MNTEEHKNIKFVQIIEQHPCLYDYSVPDYSKRDVSERAWSRVADEAKLSGKKVKKNVAVYNVQNRTSTSCYCVCFVSRDANHFELYLFHCHGTAASSFKKRDNR
jgi:hypothetical protein